MNGHRSQAAGMAQGLSNRMTGKSNYYGGGNPEVLGLEDGVSFFGGVNSFVNEDQAQVSFNFTITNTGSAAVNRTIALFAGPYSAAADIKTATGSAVAAIMTDGEIISTADAEVSVEGDPEDVKLLAAFVKNNPLRLTGIKMSVDDSSAFDQSIYVKKTSPFEGPRVTNIKPAIYKNSNQTDDKRVEIPLDHFQLDNQTVVYWTIPAGRTVTFTLFPGATKNSAAELDLKARAAYQRHRIQPRRY